MSLGNHIIVDMYHVNTKKLSNINSDNHSQEKWNEFIKNIFTKTNITLVDICWKNFNDKGAFTAIYLLAESHLSIHTWPEHEYIALDVFTCGQANTQFVVDEIVAYFEPKETKIMNIKRGEPIKNIDSDSKSSQSES
jgi:S-adenosylmethionine decarboxylase proenzyme